MRCLSLSDKYRMNIPETVINENWTMKLTDFEKLKIKLPVIEK